MDDKQFATINRSLGLIIKLLGTRMIEDKKDREQVQLLSKVGLSTKEIAELTGKTENNIRVTLHLMKKPKKKGGKEQ